MAVCPSVIDAWRNPTVREKTRTRVPGDAVTERQAGEEVAQVPFSENPSSQISRAGSAQAGDAGARVLLRALMRVDDLNIVRVGQLTMQPQMTRGWTLAKGGCRLLPPTEN